MNMNIDMADLYMRATRHLEYLHEADLNDQCLCRMAEDWLTELGDDVSLLDVPKQPSETPGGPHQSGAEIEPSEPLFSARDIGVCCLLCGSDDRLPLLLRIEAIESITTLVDAGGAKALLANGILAKLIFLLKETDTLWAVTLAAISKLWMELDDNMIFALTASDCLEALMSAASASDRPDIAGMAGWIVCSLAGHETTPSALKARTIPVVLAHGRRHCEEAKEEAAWALASISAKPEDSALLVPHLDALLALLVELTQDDAPSVQMQSAWALANLALVVDDTAKEAMAEQLTLLLLALVQRAASRQPEEAASAAPAPEEASETGMMVRQVLRCLGSLLILPTARKQLLEPSTAFLCLL